MPRHSRALLAVPFVLGAAAHAVPVPGPWAEADATARYQDNGVGSLPVGDDRFADQLAIAAGPFAQNFAISNGTGIVSDPDFGASVDGFAEIQGTASFPAPVDPSVEATTLARSRTVWEVAAGPAGAVDIDLDLALDGAFEVGNFFSNDGFDVFAQIRFYATVYDESGSRRVFEGWISALGAGAGRFDSVAPAFDFEPGDVTEAAPLGGFSTSRYEVDFARRLEDVLTLEAGDRFAVELLLTTRVTAAGPFEMHALADFEHTGTFALASGTPGVVFAQVPEPGTAALLASALALLGASRRGQACGSAAARIRRR